MMVAPIIAFALVATVPQVDAFAATAVRRQLRMPPHEITSREFPPPPPRLGVPYLIYLGERCHSGLYAIIAGVDSGQYELNKDTRLTLEFRVLRRQHCDRSRFLSYAVKYATIDREKSGFQADSQYEAILLLGQIGRVEHVKQLLPLLDDPEWQIRSAALQAIGQLGDSRHEYLVYDKLLSPKRFTGLLGVTEETAIKKTCETLRAKAAPAEEDKSDKK